MTILKNAKKAVVVGGGFYGVNLAIHLSKTQKFGSVILIERENKLLARASSNNQARVHNGYHYPRSYITAYRSHSNFSKFCNEWPDAIQKDFISLYAIARKNSKINARQFEFFCKEMNLNLESEHQITQMFNPSLIEKVFIVEEYNFDPSKLGEWCKEQLALADVEVKFNSNVETIKRATANQLEVSFKNNGVQHTMKANLLLNCTYSGLKQFTGDAMPTKVQLKHEIAELALIEMPPNLQHLGITVMDGPYFSTLPCHSKGLHSLSHVRYTPHMHWLDEEGQNPYEKLKLYNKETRVEWMIRDAQRYLPAISKARYKRSLFDIKTVLERNEIDDGRPILLEKSTQIPGLYSILGSKIDNIFDVLERLKL